MSDCGCGDAHDAQKLPAHGARAELAPIALTGGHPVLGPTLGGGVSGSHLGSGVGRVGGGLTDPVLWAHGAAFAFPQERVDYHFDYSTPQRIFQRGPNLLGPALGRELGGMLE